MWKELLMINYATLTMIICLMIFIMTNTYFHKNVRMLFLTACLMTIGLTIVDSVEYWTQSLTYPTTLRIWMSAFGYSLRPAVICIVLQLLSKDRKRARWLMIPLIFNTVIAFSALFTDIAYSYTADNQFERGPLGYFAYVTCAFYLMMLLYYTVRMYTFFDISETYIAVAVVVMFFIATALEAIHKCEGLINATGAVALVFYYLYLNTQMFMRDTMTNALNRRCFYLDAQKNRLHLGGVISIDLNDLKKWNDEYGHAKGDEAICTLSRCIFKVLPRGCHLYRTGGDEFMVLCFEKNESEVHTLVKAIQEEVKMTPFSCAIGMTYDTDKEVDFQKLCARADKEMYENKFKMKNL